ncbi:DUF2771 domain-containing protein [Mycobacterium sp. CBMA271]|uniref:DUF2771 family protein n=1 Tax=unclassified Mycobacteroides TaxID=2618759 RepID=UPI0013242303|nr:MULTISPECIES: DUF2771 family protein [unclassified Mycobacteroides]MUM15900.1 hypothetical protein [Mycobacteroides sp. CBMA 326]MUM24512.1 DUF2771 domain-containing protein [Mycobacteroides sp. CBMA 271]
MKVKLAALAAVLVLTAVGMVGFIAWQLRGHEQERPEVSAFTHGRLVRFGPVLYCDRTLTECDAPGSIAELPVKDTAPVQLSIDKQITMGPFGVKPVYAELANPSVQYAHGVTYFDHRTALTVPTVDESGRKLVGIEVSIPTVGIDELGQQDFRARAVWSVATVWNS